MTNKSATKGKNAFGGLLLAVACAGMAVEARANMDTVTFDLTTVFDVAGSPTTSGTDVQAVFQDVAGGVELTLSVSGLAASDYNLNTWWFNVASGYANTLSFAVQGSPTLTPSISQGSLPDSEAGNDGYFNLWFNSFDNNFKNGQAISYLITDSSTPGLNALDFDNLDSPNEFAYDAGGEYYSAAEIIEPQSGGSFDFYLGAEAPIVVVDGGVPDGGSTLVFLGLALSGLGGVAKKLRKV